MGGQLGAVLAQPIGGPKAALSRGIVDRIASKAAIAGEALVMAIKEWAPFLHKKVGTDLSKVTWGLLARSIEHGDTQIEEMLRARVRVVGILSGDGPALGIGGRTVVLPIPTAALLARPDDAGASAAARAASLDGITRIVNLTCNVMDLTDCSIRLPRIFAMISVRPSGSCSMTR